MESLELSKKFKFFLLLECALIISFLVIGFNFIFSFIITQKAAGHLYGYGTSTYHLISITILLVIISFISIFAVLTLQEYKKCLARRAYILNGKSNLSLTEILENENRLNILMEILKNPGIHQNELLRNCALQKGQLQWHLAILIKNGMIKKEKFGQYTIYFPITSSMESIEKYKNLPKKSETTENILDIIRKNPGINSSKISRILNLSRNTIKYHIDKLSENNLILLEEKGRKIELYPNM